METSKIPMPLANYIKQKIQDKIDIGLAPADIFIAAIHTHSAPDLTGGISLAWWDSPICL